jgi:hypothetical protein
MSREFTPVVAGDYRLTIETVDGGHLLRVVGPAPTTPITIALTPQGPVLHLEGSAAVRLTGDLAIDAARVAIRGREGLGLLSGGDLQLSAEGVLTSTARAQAIRADLGDVSIRANDDVRLDGERIKMNC